MMLSMDEVSPVGYESKCCCPNRERVDVEVHGCSRVRELGSLLDDQKRIMAKTRKAGLSAICKEGGIRITGSGRQTRR